jgi:adenylosuccinate lyase
VLLALVQSGLTRDEAYRIVQENAMASWQRGTSFRALLDSDQRLAPVPKAVLDEAFDLSRSLGHIGRVFDALDALEV